MAEMTLLIPALLLLASALLLWPSTQGQRRIGGLSGRADRHSRRPGTTVVVLAAVPVLGAVGGVGVGLAAGIVAAVGISRRRKTAAEAARAAREQELCRALGVMVAEMSVGAPLVGACKAAVDELGESRSPVAAELSRIAARVELGGGLDPDAVPADLPGLRRLSQAWAISSRHGLPMAALLDALRSDLVQRKEFAARTEAGLAGPRATAMVLAGLPLLGLGLGQLMGAAPLRVLVGTPIGSVLLVVGVGLAAAGLLWADAIVAKARR
ncbi:hypothetical protein GOHSU_32_00070 [Gordonia hirsuta DSM 44140 = NBRC 16056]|uniref:Type II secretion system protein GspF domain-containing protein n=1 Tax=Gordonia hirsuta DSM 44140 = NBRC 16056 TaxID=1121927 RepID=L7LAM0_9ACTN|nr:type II secretion system F family protein [Gordonia hirsuta]GAC58190.1 hypothetical protein GOHSU_32_00070 [Gordonia hirsuta DSM 44140 = NBRC 16056]